MRIGRLLLSVLALTLLCSLALGLPPGMTSSTPSPRTAKASATEIYDTQTMINVNNMEMFVTNQGSFASDLSGYFGKTDGLYFPAGTDKTPIYAGGIWVGGKVGGTIRLVIGGHTTEYFPGPADENGDAQEDQPSYKVYKIMSDSTKWLKKVKSGYELLDSTNHFDDYLNWPVADGAPLDGADNPLMLGDQTLWAVYNDGGKHTYGGYGGATESLGVEIQQTVFGYDLPGALGNTIFMKFIVINKSPNTIDSTYISLWSDPDLGGASDDLVGCDTTRSLGYCYNATNSDETYAANPPAVGYDFMQGPIIRESDNDPIYAGVDFSDKFVVLNTGDTIFNAIMLGMMSFNKYINGTDPDTPDEGYNYMRGWDAKATPPGPYKDPETGIETAYFGAGNPVTGKGWIDTNPADRRFMCNTGPFTMQPDDTQLVVAAVVVGQAKDRLSSISAMKFYDDLAQYAYNENFDLPLPPPRPVVIAEAFDRKVSLTWTNRSEVEYKEPFHSFEGYIVYQGETVAGPWKVVKIFDIKNLNGSLKDFLLNTDLGDVVYQPVVYGTDEGIDYGIEITEDAVLGGRLHNGQTYYFAVTAYSYDYGDNATYLVDPTTEDTLYNIPKGFWFLENGIQPIPITPQDDIPGTVWGSAVADVVQSRVDPAFSPATDIIEANIIDPTKINGHSYEVRFRDLYDDTLIDTTVVPPETTIVPIADSLLVYEDGEWIYAYQYWELWDLTDGVRLLERQTNKSGDGYYEIFDGIQFKVVGSHIVEFQGAFYRNNNAAHRRALGGVNWAGAFYDGGVDYGWNFWGGYLDPAVPDSFTTIQIRFTDDIPLAAGDTPSGQRAYSYCRGCTPNYGYAGYFVVPFEVWDATNDRQVNCCFVEWNGSDVYDSTWDPDASDLGGREYLLPLRSDYDGDDPADAGTGAIDYTTEDFYDGSTFDFLYGAWLRLRASTDVIDSGDVFEFLFANPADSNDVYTIHTTSAITGDMAIAKSALDNIRAVPNPYYAYSVYEANQFDRQIRFLGVPEEFTMRIFNIAGDKVRTLTSDEKIPGYSWITWDLLTDQGLPVAAGIYIWYIDAPGIGTKYGKMAVFPEVEQLNTY